MSAPTYDYAAPVIIPAYAADHAAIFEAAYRQSAMRHALFLLANDLATDAAETLRRAMVFAVEKSA